MLVDIIRFRAAMERQPSQSEQDLECARREEEVRLQVIRSIIKTG